MQCVFARKNRRKWSIVQTLNSEDPYLNTGLTAYLYHWLLFLKTSLKLTLSSQQLHGVGTEIFLLSAVNKLKYFNLEYLAYGLKNEQMFIEHILWDIYN